MNSFLGLPPPNGVLPQSPLHTRVCCTLRMTADAARQAKAKKQQGDLLDPFNSSNKNKKRADSRTSQAPPQADGNGIKAEQGGSKQPEGVTNNPGSLVALGMMQDKEVDYQVLVHSNEGEGSNHLTEASTIAMRREAEGAQGNGVAGVVEQQKQQQQHLQQKQRQQQQHQQQQQEEGGIEGGASCYHQVQMQPEGFGERTHGPLSTAASVEPGYSGNQEGDAGARKTRGPSRLARRSVQLPIPHDLLAKIPSNMQQNIFVNHPHHYHQNGAKAGAPTDIVHDPAAAAHIRSRQEPTVDDCFAAPPAREYEEGAVLELRVAEQRLTNLIQSLCVVASLAAVHVLQLIPTAVVWAYFAYMAIESFPGNQLWNRMLLMLTDPKRRTLVLENVHAAYMETVPFRVVAAFTAFEFVYLGGLWALVTWAGIGGVAFPAPIIALIPIRSYVLTRLFKPEHLAELDAEEYDIVEGIPPEQAVQETGQAPFDIRDIVEGQYTGTQVMHRLSHEALRRRSHMLAPEASLARATAPAQFHHGSDTV